MNLNSDEILLSLRNILGLTESGGRLDSNRESRREESHGDSYDSVQQKYQPREKYEWRSPPGRHSCDNAGGNAQKGRKKLQLAPRTKPIELIPPPADAATSNSIFGGAKPVNTAAREREIEERLANEKEGEEARLRKFGSSSGLSNRSRGSSVSSQPGSWYHDDVNASSYKTPFPRQHERGSPTHSVFPKTRQRSSSNSSSIESDRENQINTRISLSQSNRNKGVLSGVKDVLSPKKSEYHSYGRTNNQVLQYFYENDLHTDIVFHVRCGDGYIRFPCHKLVLSLWSPVFADMFFNKKLSETIEITVVPPSAFDLLIKYCYGIETELQKYRNDVNFLLKVYKGAQEYKIKGLQVLCCEIFSCALPNKDNVFELLDAASFIGSESLKVRCHKILQTQTKQIMESRELSNISRSIINTILEMPILSFDSECELITWMFEWGSQESVKLGDINLREIMTPFLPRLNFMSLTPEEFGSLILNHKEFFDEKEGFEILMNIIFPHSWPLPHWFGEEFNRSYIYSNNELLTEFCIDS